MAFYDRQERHIADLHEAFRTESIDRRTFLKVAGAAALATGLSHNAVTPTLAAPSRVRAVRAQADANVLVYGSGQDISNLDPHTGHDYSITWGQRAVYDSLLRYEGKPGRAEAAAGDRSHRQPRRHHLDDQAGRQRDLPRRFDGRRRGRAVQLPAHAAQEPRRGLDVRRRDGPGLDRGRRSDDAQDQPAQAVRAVRRGPPLALRRQSDDRAGARRRRRRGRGLAEGERGRRRSLHDRALGNRQRLRVRALSRTTGSTRRTASSRSTASSGGSFASRRPSASPWRRASSSTATASRPRIIEALAADARFVANQTIRR